VVCSALNLFLYTHFHNADLSEDTMTASTIDTLTLAIAAACYGTGAMAQVPAAVAAPGETTVVTFQGEGAKIY
jgi:hypothetical protein